MLFTNKNISNPLLLSAASFFLAVVLIRLATTEQTGSEPKAHLLSQSLYKLINPASRHVRSAAFCSATLIHQNYYLQVETGESLPCQPSFKIK